MPRRHVKSAAPAASAWGSPGAGGEFTDLFERILAAVQASPEARATLPAMRLVSKTWRDFVDDRVQELEPTAPIREPQLSQLLRRFTRLRAINPDEWPMPLRCEDATLPALLGLKKLEALALNFNFGPESVVRLAPLGAHLTMLSYAGEVTTTRSRRRNLGTGLTNAAARVIGSSLISLQRLNISRCSELGEGVAAFSSLTRLQSLRLYEISGLNDNGFIPAVSGLTRLTSLTVAMCDIGDASMTAVAQLTLLETLDLSQNAELGDLGVARLAPLLLVTSLSLSGASTVTLGTLPPLISLRHLEVASTDTDDTGLMTLERLPLLARLSIADCQAVSGGGLFYLALVPGLQSLNLSSCLELGEDDPLLAIQHLTGLTSLKMAFIEGLEDRDLEHLGPLTRLEVLTLNGLAELYGPGLVVLKSLKSLRVLSMPDLPLSPADADAIRVALPNLTDFTYEQAGTMERLLNEMAAIPEDDE